MSKISILLEFWEYLKVRKKWWLAPIIIFLVLFSLAYIPSIVMSLWATYMSREALEIKPIISHN